MAIQVAWPCDRKAAWGRFTGLGIDSLAAINRGVDKEKCNSSGQQGESTLDPFPAMCYVRSTCHCRSELCPLVLHSLTSRLFFPALCAVSIKQ